MEDNTRRAFIKGISVGLVIPAASWCLWVATWTLLQVPRHEEVFKSVRVNLPPATEFLLRGYVVAAAILGVAGIACIVATARYGDRRAVAALNVACWVFAMAWQAYVSVALSTVLLSVFQGIGS